MPGPLTIARRMLPPAFVLFLFVDLVVNPYVPRLGTVSAGAKQNGRLTVDESRTLQGQSRKLVAAGKDEQAIKPALQLYEAYPENHIYSQMLAQISHRLGRYEDEVKYWESFVEHAPLPIEACPDIGLAYAKLGRAKESIGALERCRGFEADNYDSMFALAHAWEQDGQTARAAALYREALARHPHNTDCTLGLARTELRTGRLASARRLANEVLAESPQNVDALLVAGLVAQGSGELAVARRMLEQGLRLSPRYVDFYVALGRVEAAQGRRREAAARLDEALALDPENREASRLRAGLR